MLKITFQRFKDSVHSDCRYQIPLTLQCEMMAPQGLVSIDCNFPQAVVFFTALWVSLLSAIHQGSYSLV